ncbi:ferric reductase-like transmembrane domain-containing protein [Streptomyces sp. N50]|uniref:ferredoxin reductase family protein n=1 Tax=Streptomyces sp. N50 TaxID=3081765 RepID=UPI002961F857|nr:ferric reductase-like transmembrane domain-containing protein [Streptomyces sp. N50]WOX13908.1 ferric reductase-like transmembrane domain-containing protein [Streptomyces sp. N50]
MTLSTELPRGQRTPPAPPRRGRFTLADPLGALAILSVVAVVALWVMNQGGPLSLTASDRATGSLGLLAGLLASDLMILQVLLLARIPWVERSWGHDLLTRRHRLIGFASFWLMTAHVILFAVERSTREPTAIPDALLRLFVTDSWMLFATVGTLLLIMVVVTSVRAARRRLRYESWHLLHLYSYAGIAATFPHTFTDGADFHETWTRVYWWCLYGFAFAATLLHRVALPAWRSLYHRLRVESVVTEAPGTVSVTLKGHRLDRMRTASGQFFVWRFLDGPGWSRGNPYTLSAAPTPDRLRITIKSAGDGSERAARLTPGTRALIEGPYGTLTARHRTHPGMLLMAAGIGITPMRALLEDAPYAPGEATLIYRYGEDEHAVFADELRAIAADRGVELILLPGPRRADTSWQAAGPLHRDGTSWPVAGPAHRMDASRPAAGPVQRADTSWQTAGPAHRTDASLQAAASAHRVGTSRQTAGPAHPTATPEQTTAPTHLDDDAQVLKNLVPDIAHRDIYVCGPPTWITAVRKAARAAGAHRDSVHTEEFAW